MGQSFHSPASNGYKLMRQRRDIEKPWKKRWKKQGPTVPVPIPPIQAFAGLDELFVQTCHRADFYELCLCLSGNTKGFLRLFFHEMKQNYQEVSPSFPEDMLQHVCHKQLDVYERITTYLIYRAMRLADKLRTHRPRVVHRVLRSDSDTEVNRLYASVLVGKVYEVECFASTSLSSSEQKRKHPPESEMTYVFHLPKGTPLIPYHEDHSHWALLPPGTRYRVDQKTEIMNDNGTSLHYAYIVKATVLLSSSSSSLSSSTHRVVLSANEVKTVEGFLEPCRPYLSLLSNISS
jgi:hypothetical protein